LRREDRVSVECRGVSRRQARVSDGRPERRRLIEGGLGQRVEFEAGTSRVKPAQARSFSGSD
jgi:hypothetical protein